MRTVLFGSFFCLWAFSILAAAPLPELMAWQRTQCWPGDSVVLGADGTVEVMRDVSDLREGVAAMQPRGLFADIVELHAYTWLMGVAATTLMVQVPAARQLRLTLFVNQGGAVTVVGRFRMSRATVEGAAFAPTAALAGLDTGQFITKCRRVLDGVWQNSSVR